MTHTTRLSAAFSCAKKGEATVAIAFVILRLFGLSVDYVCDPDKPSVENIVAALPADLALCAFNGAIIGAAVGFVVGLFRWHRPS